MTPLLRPLLLLVLALGVVGMHTLGHVSSGHGEVASHSAPPPTHAARSMTAQPMTAQAMTAQAMTAQAGEAAIGSGILLWVDPGDMCLAVLTSVFVLLLAVAWAAALRWPDRTAVKESWAGGVARSPPRRLAPGLVRLAVMRL